MSTLIQLTFLILWSAHFNSCEKPDFVIVETNSGQPLPPPSLVPPNVQPPVKSEGSQLEPYDIIVHLHRSRRFLLTGAKAEGKLLVKLFPLDGESIVNPTEQVFELDLTTTRLKTLTKQVMLNPELLIIEEPTGDQTRSRSTERERSAQQVKSMVSVMYTGDGEGSLEIRRISFIPSGGTRRLDNLKKSKCAKFDDNNLLESRLGIQKVLSHKDCQSRLVSRG